MVRRSVLCAALVTVGLLAAACDVTVPGQAARAGAHAVGVPLNTHDVFGNASTMDPCSIIDVSSMPPDMRVAGDQDDGFDDCPVAVTLATGRKLYGSVGPLETLQDDDFVPSKQIAALSRGMRIESDVVRNPGQCYDELIFPDELRLLISAVRADSNDTANPCPVADALAGNAAAAILAGSARHRTYPSGSVGGVDPCGLVSPAMLQSIALLAVAPVAYPQRHRCKWESGQPDGLTLRVQFAVGSPPAATGSSDTVAMVAGRKTVAASYADPGGGGAICIQYTGLRPYGDEGTGLVEIAAVQVDAADTTEACAAGQVIAAAMWPKLPHTG